MSPEQQGEMMDILRQLGNGLYARAQSENKKKPELIPIALNGAQALLAPEGGTDEVNAAQTMVDELKLRYYTK